MSVQEEKRNYMSFREAAKHFEVSKNYFFKNVYCGKFKLNEEIEFRGRRISFERPPALKYIVRFHDNIINHEDI